MRFRCNKLLFGEIELQDKFAILIFNMIKRIDSEFQMIQSLEAQEGVGVDVAWNHELENFNR